MPIDSPGGAFVKYVHFIFHGFSPFPTFFPAAQLYILLIMNDWLFPSTSNPSEEKFY